MELFWRAAAGVLVAVVLGLSLGKDMHVLLSMAVCAMGAMIALEYLEPVLDLLRRLEALADLNTGMLGILLKCTGIALVSELAGMVCTDAGSSSLGRVIKLLGSMAVLWLSVPVFQAVLSILQQIMGEI